ncbi:MAG: MoxR family ATPase [Candidatus Krumholzibacteria bacterium]|nr:MoxR family ATPase [Candidatus Krumholzibacteria bacterium]MDP6668353.1 MoxR family ATPase [Candidatus Krumholzibacteria bacterium]MDP6796287.1 MoxR family ATPase [Candidatus Krumholzibacteria bacterium]MDP7022192.1 MoxR family ATPase [Candidatus Krumholzibacteria bacterium]
MPAAILQKSGRPELDIEKLESLHSAHDQLKKQVSKVIVGQDAVVREILISLFAGGHSLLLGVPGLAKTLLVSTLAQALDLRFNRVQFTPDLMPGDITGTEILEEDKSTGKRVFRFVKGPVFANVILADEINRTPPKTQAALLQAMQEHQVTAAGETHTLEEPFYVLATQNPIEQEGTYPLPEAQLDRFMFNILVDYPSEQEEVSIVERTTAGESPELSPVLGRQDIVELQALVRRIPASEQLVEYAVRLARASRPGEDAPDFVRDFVSWGAGPRAAQYLVLGAKSLAALEGRPVPEIEDVRTVARPVLRHRLVTNFNAEAEGIRPDDLVSRLLEAVSA